MLNTPNRALSPACFSGLLAHVFQPCMILHKTSAGQNSLGGVEGLTHLLRACPMFPKNLLMGQSIWLHYTNEKFWVHPWCHSIMWCHLVTSYLPNNRVQNARTCSSNNVNSTFVLCAIRTYCGINIIAWASISVLDPVIGQKNRQKMIMLWHHGCTQNFLLL
jgi:hypothetical protein